MYSLRFRKEVRSLRARERLDEVWRVVALLVSGDGGVHVAADGGTSDRRRCHGRERHSRPATLPEMWLQTRRGGHYWQARRKNLTVVNIGYHATALTKGGCRQLTKKHEN